MIYFSSIIALIVGAFVGCYMCPHREGAMIKEAQRCRAELKEANKIYNSLALDYADCLDENARLCGKLSYRLKNEAR